MPELPDVEGFKNTLDRHALGRKVEAADVLDERIVEGIEPSRLIDALRGCSLTRSERYGKILLVETDGDGGAAGWLVMRFGMTGELVFEECRDAALPRHTRLVLDPGEAGRLAYRSQRMLGHVTLVADRDRFIERLELGPDGLSPALDRQRLRAALERRRGPVKSLLMDQSLVAGIGTVYADEILFQARLHPATRGTELTDRQIGRLARTLKRVLRTAAERGGDVDRLPKRYLLPQRRPGGRCPACDGSIETAKIGGRTACFCPACQRR